MLLIGTLGKFFKALWMGLLQSEKSIDGIVKLRGCVSYGQVVL